MTCMTRLGELERAVMQAVWDAAAPVTGRQVAEVLAPRGLAYTTVLTVLTRLERKGLVRRDSSARAHTYAPVGSRENHVAVLMQQALGQADDRAAALQHFARSVTPDEAEALRRALDGPD
ncbi:MAG: transcriptional repressor, CopY family [Frankiales bacterium]|nr:transcriptional repressor, CopY family [Frankiales bacterium]